MVREIHSSIGHGWEEMLFGASFGSLYTKDGNEWKQQEGFALPPAIRGFCYDPYQQRICVIDGSCAIAYALTGEEIVRTYLPRGL